MKDLSENRKKWLDGLRLSNRFTEREMILLERASFVFENNLFKDENSLLGGFRGILPSPGKYNGVWNWDSAFHALALSNFDADIAYEQFRIFFAFQGTDGIFPDVIYADGTVKDNYSKPPVFPWAFTEVYERSPRPDFLNEAYCSFCRNLKFWNNNRRDKKSGLYYYDCTPVDGNWSTHQKWESGMDNSPRWDNGVSRWLAPDLNGFMVMFYDALNKMSVWLNLPDDAEEWKSRSMELKNLINNVLWCEDKNCFLDRDRFTGEFSDVLSSACFVPLFSGCAGKDKAYAMNIAAGNPELFFPSMPTVAFSCDSFSASDYWRGPVWLNFAYFASEGLRKYGFEDTGDLIKEHVLSDVFNEKRGIYEYYNARTGEGLGAVSFGWSAAFVIEFIVSSQKEQSMQ